MSNSFSDPRFEPPGSPLAYAAPPRSKSGFKILLLVFGIGGLCLVLCCGGGIGMSLFFMKFIAAEVEQELRDHPQVREHLGEIQELEMDFTQSIAHDDDDVFVYNVKGTRGEGELTVEQYTDDDGDEVISSAELRLPDGRRIELDLDRFE